MTDDTLSASVILFALRWVDCMEGVGTPADLLEAEEHLYQAAKALADHRR